MPQSAGKRRHLLGLYRFTVTGADDRNQPTGEWKCIDQFYCSITPLSGRQGEIARQLVTTATHKIETYWSETPRPEDEWRTESGRKFAIGHLANVGELDRDLESTVTELVSVTS